MRERKIGWEFALETYIEERRKMPFEWGKHDCCRFACGALIAQGLPDPMERVEPYETKEGAVRQLARLGHGSLDEAAANLAYEIGLTEIPVAFAGRGCIVMADLPVPDTGAIEPHLGLVDLDCRHALFPSGIGLVRIRLSGCRRAWQVG